MRHKPQLFRVFGARRLLELVGVLLVVATSGVSFLDRPQPAAAAATSTVNFQARLETISGSIAADGDYNVEFKIYDVASGGATAQGACTGNCRWMETRTSTDKVRVANGYLTASLGSITPFSASMPWDQELWITMNIGGTGSPSWDGEMSPRLKLTAVPYAFQAAQASKLQVTSGGNTATLQFASVGQNTTVTLPDPGGAGTATVCYQGSASCGFVSGTSANFIQNGTSVQTNANFNIRSAATGSVGAVIQGANGQTADLLQLQSYNGTTSTNVFGVNNNGVVTLNGGQTIDVTTASAGTATGLTLQPGVSTAATTTGAGITIKGGEANGTTTVTAGSVTIQGGSATGASGTRNGGSVFIDGGTGNTTYGSVNIGTVGNASKTIQIGNSTLNAGTQTINIGNANTSGGTTNVSIGSGSSATGGATTVQAKGAVTVTAGAASTWSTTAGLLTIQGGGGVTINTPGSTSASTNGITIQSGSATTGSNLNAGTILIDTGTQTGTGTANLNIGTTNARAIGIGSTGANTVVTVQGGGGVNIGTGGVTGAVQIGNTTGGVAQTINMGTNAVSGSTTTVNIGTGATTVAGGKTINIGNTAPTGSGTNLISIGTTTNASTTTIQGGTGSGAVSVQAGTSGTISVGTANANTISIGSTNSSTATTVQGGGGVNIGTGGTTGAIQIGNTTGGVAQSINIGTNATASATNTITIGAASTSSSSVTVNAGTGAGNTILLQGNNSTGGVKVKSATNSTAAFLIQDSGTNDYLTVDTSGAAISVGYASSTTTLNGTVKVTTLGAATVNSGLICRDSSTNALTACNVTLTGNAFVQGGNSFGTTALLGTTDANNLQIQTNSVVRATFDQSNGLYLGNGITAATPNNFTVAGTGSLTAGTAGAQLTLQGGAGAATTTGSAGGNVVVKGGAAAGSGNNNGGNVLIQGGTPINTGSGGQVIVRNGADTTGAFQVQNAAATSTVFNVDTVNGRVGVGGVASFSKFEVLNGDAAVYNSGNNPRLVLGDSTTFGQNGYLQWDSAGDYFRIETVGTNGLKIKDNYVAIGNFTPTQPLIVGNGTTNLFQVDTAGVVTVGGGAPVIQAAASQKLDITGNAASTWSTTSGDLSIQAAGALNLGNSGGSAINVGTNASAHTIAIGTGAAVQGITIGSTNSTSTTAINGGNGATAISLQAASGGTIVIGNTNSNTVNIGGASSTVSLSNTVQIGSLGSVTANTRTVCRDDTTGALVLCDATIGSTRPFLQGGNSFGAAASLGTNDANNLQIKTNSIIRATFDQSNGLYVGLGVTNVAPTAFTIAGTGSSTAGTAGSTLTVKGGAGASTTTGSAGGGLTLAGGNAGGSGNNAGGQVLLQGGSATGTGTVGNVLVKNLTDSGVAFDVQDANGLRVFSVGTGQRLAMIGQTQGGTSTSSPGFLYLSDVSSNAAGNAQITGQWASSANWGLGPNSNANDSTLRFGLTSAAAGNTWNTSGANLNLLVAGTLRVTPNGTNDSLTAFQVQRASGNGAATVFDVDTTNSRIGIGTAAPSYDLSFGGASNRVLGVETQGTTNTAGVSLTVRGATGNGTGQGGTVTVQGGQGGATGQGGNLNLTGGAAGGGNNNGGTINIAGGAGAGTGATGLVVINTPTFQTASAQACGSNCTITQANVDGNGAVIINATAASLTVTMNDPTITTAGRIVYVTAANGSNDFTLSVNGGGTGNQIAMRQNTTATMIWNGSDWTAAGASSSTTLQAAYDNTLTSAGGAELVLSNTANANGLTIRDSSTNSVNGTLLEVQSSTAANLFSVNSNVTDYATDAGAEVAGASSSTFPASTWSANGSASVSRYITAGNFIATGIASVQTTTTAAAGDGVKNTLSTALTANNHYNVSFTTRLTSGTFTNMDVYYSINGTATSVLCTSGQAVKTSVWTKVNCTFTAPSSGITSTNAILIRQTTSAVRTFYVDNLSVTIAADFNLATDGTVNDGVNFATNWLYTTGTGTGTVTRSTSDGNDASDSAQIAITAGAANAGGRNKLSINPLQSTLYRVSVYAKLNSGAAFTDFKMRYSRDGGTNFVDCVDYNTQTVVTTGWTQITCYITTDGTAPSSPHVYFVETASAVRTFSVDTFSMTLAQNTTPNVQIGGGLNGGPVTLFTLDRGASAPIAANNDAFLGSMYYDTGLGKLQCYEADGWGACGSSPDNIITISPEYTNAVLNGTGVGTMTSDICSDQLNLNDGSSGSPTICGTNETYNFYRWTSPQASAQTYSIYVTYQLPGTFKGFASGNTSIMGRTDSASSTVQYTVYRNSGSGLSQCGSTVAVSTGSVSSWQTGTASGAADPSTCGFAGGNSIVFKIDVIASVNANAYVGNLNFTFTNQ